MTSTHRPDREQPIGVLVPAPLTNRPRAVPAPIPVLPAPRPPIDLSGAEVVLGMACPDRSGRITDRAVLQALPGHPAIVSTSARSPASSSSPPRERAGTWWVAEGSCGYPPAKSEALSMLGSGHPHASRVRALLTAARVALQAEPTFACSRMGPSL